MAGRPVRLESSLAVRCDPKVPWGGAATHLEEARAQIPQHAAERPALFIGGYPGWVLPARGGRAEPERTRQHPLSDQALHGLELLRCGVGPLRSGLTHHIASDPRVADQGPHVDAAPLAEGLQVLGDGLPGEVDSLSASRSAGWSPPPRKIPGTSHGLRPRRGDRCPHMPTITEVLPFCTE